MTSWAVAISKPRQERAARDRLLARSLACFLPLIQIRKKVEPLFPRYLFVCVGDAWRDLLTTVGILDVVRMGAQAALVPEAVVNNVRLMCDEANIFMSNEEIEAAFRVGQKVVIERGAFAGHKGSIARLSGKQRAEVLINLLGGLVRVSLKESDLVAA